MQPSPRHCQHELTPEHLSAFPALGFFGATPSDCLVLKLAGPIRALKLALGSETSEYLNLRGVRLFKNGAALALDLDQVEVQAGSSRGVCEKSSGLQLLEMRGYHSSREEGAWWQARFAQPLDADELRIYNRADRWGSRSADLSVSVVDASGTSRTIYRGRGVQAMAMVKGALSSLGIDVPAQGITARWRVEVLSRVAGLLRTKADAVPAAAWRGLIQLVDIWSARDPTDDELSVVAGFLIAQREQHYPTSLRAFSEKLSSRRALDRLGAALVEVARVKGSDPLMLTRHGLSAAGKLLGRTPAVLDHLHAVVDVLEARGGAPMLAYGTLLGAVRAEAFIPHDDDVDVLFLASSTGTEGLEKEMASLRDFFIDAGFSRVDLVRGSLNIHVFNAVNGTMVDVFPCWRADGEIRLHMESMKVRGLPEEIFHPRSVVRLYGRLYPAPGMPELFLTERYGARWADPDPYFEWPWKLHDDGQS